MTFQSFKLNALPAAFDLTQLVLKDWYVNKIFDTSQYVIQGGHPYVCILDHAASGFNMPGIGKQWPMFWVRAVWPDSHYFITTVPISQYVTDNSPVPVISPINVTVEDSSLFTVGTLLTSATSMRAFVTDSLDPALGNFGKLVQGSGTNTVPVFFSEGLWYIG